MYKRISYSYFVLSLVGHLALLLGIAVYYQSPDNWTLLPHQDREEKFKVRLYDTPGEGLPLTAQKEEQVVKKEKEVVPPEKKILDFSDIPAGKEPKKAEVYGKVSTEARNDFYETKSEKTQHSETVAALPPARPGSQEFSQPVKLLPGTNERRTELSQEKEGAGEAEKPETRAKKSAPEQNDARSAEKREVFKEKNLFARYEPPPAEIKEKVREPKVLEKMAKGEDALRLEDTSDVRQKKQETSSSQRPGTPFDATELLNKGLSFRFEQVPDIPADKLGEHATIKNSDRNASNTDDAKVVSLDTQELQYVSYFWHIKQKISNVWIYPAEAQYSGMEGMTVMRLSLLRSGKLESVQLVRSSGFSVLDDEAKGAITTAAPFHAFPEQIKDQKLIIEGYFRYLGGYSSLPR